MGEITEKNRESEKNRKNKKNWKTENQKSQEET
jgi:hypothetical protein